MVQSIVQALNTFLGSVSGWYHSMTTGTQNMQWDYGLMMQYFFAGVILCITISYVFRIVMKIFE